jgi:NADH:ubiquinone reductase (H+-translocating)
MKRIIVVGGGFAGMWAALAAARKLELSGVGPGDVDITLINRDGYHCIRPRLYESELTNARIPLAPVLEPAGVNLLEGRVQSIDGNRQIVDVATDAGAQKMPYDRLVFAAGSILQRPNLPGITEHTFDIDTFESADRLNRHIEQLPGLRDTKDRLTIVVVGAGFTGLEILCELPGRLAALTANIRTIHPPRVIAVDQESALGATLGRNPQAEIARITDELGIESRLGRRVTKANKEAVFMDDGSSIQTRTVIWTGGAKGNPMVHSLGVELDALGRAPVDGNLRVIGAGSIFAAGDAARVKVDDFHDAVMSCQHAMPQGKFAGHNAAADVLGEPCLDYSQPTYVTCLGMGPNDAIYTEGWDRVVRDSKAQALKQDIITQWIYPPASGDRAEILAAAEPVTVDYY